MKNRDCASNTGQHRILHGGKRKRAGYTTSNNDLDIPIPRHPENPHGRSRKLALFTSQILRKACWVNEWDLSMVWIPQYSITLVNVKGRSEIRSGLVILSNLAKTPPNSVLVVFFSSSNLCFSSLVTNECYQCSFSCFNKIIIFPKEMSLDSFI